LLLSGCSHSNNKETTTTPVAEPADFQIKTLSDLKQLAERANSGETFDGKVIRLENDINLTDNEKQDGGPISWSPIWNAPNDDSPISLKGTFDGNGKTIYCNINKFEPLDSSIFGVIGTGGILKNLTLKGKLEGDFSGLITTSRGTIENFKIDATMVDEMTSICGICMQNDGVIKDCEVRGELKVNDGNCSGICCRNDGTVEGCKVNAQLSNCVNCINENPDITADGTPVLFHNTETGGIAAFNRGLIKNCCVVGNLTNEFDGKLYGGVGGLVSTNNGLVENSSFEGTTKAYGSGGLVGDNYAIVQNCKAKGSIHGTEAAEFADKNQYSSAHFEWPALKASNSGPLKTVSLMAALKLRKRKATLRLKITLTPR
jgi:hypothetical protein